MSRTLGRILSLGRLLKCLVPVYDGVYPLTSAEVRDRGHDGDPPRPAKLDRMVSIARTPPKDRPFIRVDLYNCDERIYFGEVTFHPERGFVPIMPDEWGKILGGLLTLPEFKDHESAQGTETRGGFPSSRVL